MLTSKPKVVAVVGPTASGKTTLSIKIAQKFNGEIISADSRQIYRKLNIGTGKITPEEMSDIPHHLIDIVDIGQPYTAIDFKADSINAIEKITDQNKLPIVVGGTFFYLDTLRNKTQSAPVPPNPDLRIELEKLSTTELFTTLQNKDPQRAENIDRHNRRRLIRSLEIIASLGKVPIQPKIDSPYDWLIIGLKTEKVQLLKNFELRIKHWLKAGFANEVKKLLQAGVTKEQFQEIGFEYTLMLSHLNGELTETELIEKFQQKNWQYAKRQTMWLKRDKEVEWFETEDTVNVFQYLESHLVN